MIQHVLFVLFFTSTLGIPKANPKPAAKAQPAPKSQPAPKAAARWQWIDDGPSNRAGLALDPDYMDYYGGQSQTEMDGGPGAGADAGKRKTVCPYRSYVYIYIYIYF